MKGVYRIRITPADVGSRVTVRYRLTMAESGPTTSDVVGHLLSWKDGMLVIRTRTDEERRVRAADLVAAKVIDDLPPRSSARPG